MPAALPLEESAEGRREKGAPGPLGAQQKGKVGRLCGVGEVFLINKQTVPGDAQRTQECFLGPSQWE